MASESSFDITSSVDVQEVLNAITHSLKEIGQRFDFKGSKTTIELNQDKGEITIMSDDDYKLKSVVDILESKCVKRKVSLKALDFGKIEAAAGSTVRQVVTLQKGISTERGKEIVKLIKGLKLKVQVSIQDDQVRVKGKKKDELQAVMEAVKTKGYDFDIQFTNYR
jgi:hypothetical protein